MKSQGFTLVELLAVIAILAILVIIALPNIMNLFNEAKMNSFITETKSIINGATQQWMSDSMFDTNEIVYSRVKGQTCPKSLKLSGREEINYYIKVNKAGKVTEYYVEDGTYQYSYNGTGLNAEDITEVQQIAKLNDSQLLSISCSSVSGGTNGGNNGGSNSCPQIPEHPPVDTYYVKFEGTINIGDTVEVDNNEVFDNVNGALQKVYWLNTFIGLVTSNDVVEDAYLGIFRNNHLYYLKGGEPCMYEQNQNVLKEAMGEENCNFYSNGGRNFFQCSNNGFYGQVDENGEVDYWKSADGCSISSQEIYCFSY